MSSMKTLKIAETVFFIYQMAASVANTEASVLGMWRSLIKSDPLDSDADLLHDQS